MNKKIELGDTVEDIHTGFKGVAMIYSKFFNGCEQYDVVPKVDKDNKPTESLGIDIQSLKIVKRGKAGKIVDKDKKQEEKEEERFVGGPISKSRKLRGF